MPQRLLMIEDDARLAEMVGQYLEQSGFGFMHKGDGASGLAAVQESAPDLVVLDLMLPGMVRNASASSYSSPSSTCWARTL